MLFRISLRVRRCFFNSLMVVLLGILFFLLNFMLLGTQTISSADDRLQTIYDGEEYYFIYKDFEANDWGIFNNSVERLNELKQFLKEVSQQQIFDYYLQNDQYLELVDFDNNTKFIHGYKEKSNDNRFELFGEIYFRAKAYHISQNVFEKFIHKVEKGRMFDETDFVYNSEYVPVVVGYNYGRQFAVGDTLEGFYWNKRTKFKIVGILEENESILSFKTGDLAYLDNHILVPTLTFPNEPENAPGERKQTEDEQLLQATACSSYLSFIITMADGYTLEDFIACYEGLREKYNIPDYYVANINMFAIEMLQISNMEYFSMIKILLCLVTIFSVICFCIFMGLTTIKNLNTYFIHMLLGANAGRIYGMVTMTAVSIMIPSQFLAFGGSMIFFGDYSMLLIPLSILMCLVGIIPAIAIIKRFKEKDFYWRKE